MPHLNSLEAGFFAFGAMLCLAIAFVMRRSPNTKPGTFEEMLATGILFGSQAVWPVSQGYPQTAPVRAPVAIAGIAACAWFLYRAWLLQRSAGK